MRDLSVQICENMEKHTLTWHLQLWLYLFEEPFQTLFSVLSLIFPHVSITNQYQSTNQAHCIYFCLKIKCFLSFSFSLSLSLSLSLSRNTFRVKKAMKFFIFSTKISDIERSPTTIHDQPQFGLHHPQPSTVTHGKPKFCHHYPRLCTTSHNFTSTIYNHPRSAIVPLPPPTVLNFTEKLTL